MTQTTRLAAVLCGLAATAPASAPIASVAAAARTAPVPEVLAGR